MRVDDLLAHRLLVLPQHRAKGSGGGGRVGSGRPGTVPLPPAHGPSGSLHRAMVAPPSNGSARAFGAPPSKEFGSSVKIYVFSNFYSNFWLIFGKF